MAITQSTIKQINKNYHRHSDTIHSMDFYKVPKELRAAYGVDAEAFKIYTQLPYCRTDEGQILVNEALPDWKLMRELLLALDRLPDSLLIDIYRMDKHRWTEGELDNMDGDTEDEMLRKILYRLIPEITWAHSFHKN